MKTYTVAEVAEKLHVTTHAVYAAIRRGTLKAKLPIDTVITEAALEAYLKHKRLSLAAKETRLPEEIMNRIVFLE
jgi:predicted DNA-binding protein YlxM (UPF0122 family)